MDTQTVQELASTVADLAAQLEQLKIASSSGSAASTSSRMAPEPRTLLEPRSMEDDIQTLVKTAVQTSILQKTGEQRAPPLPIFTGQDFRLFLQRYTR